jgi:tRNA modification GTPase
MSKITDFSKTIVALATAIGTGSIAVVRVSGSRAISIVDQIFQGKNLIDAGGNTIHFGKIKNGDFEIDQVIVSLFRSPHSYTGEDVIEISCHANPLIVQEIVEILLSNGAHHATPGEFTLRAFLNGKIDLAQAEAVSDVISAKTKRGLQNSIGQLEGSLTGYLSAIKQKLIEILGLLEIDLDFSEEDLDVVSAEEIKKGIGQIQEKLEKLTNTFNYGKMFNSAINLVIAGEPNVGKSTLMNYLLGENRAITSHQPGTTRDTIHENVVIDHTFFKLIDTAGLRNTDDIIETAGIERTRQQIATADIILYVLDASKSKISPKDIVDRIYQAQKSKYILVANKTDLGISDKIKALKEKTEAPVVYISAITGDGINNLKDEIIKKVSIYQGKAGDEIVITGSRHKKILDQTKKYLENATNALNIKEGFEFVSVDIREALDSLGEITGETATDDILNQIFQSFCIGK